MGKLNNRNARTFENNSIFRDPDTAKDSVVLGGFKKYSARRARVVRENTDFRMPFESLDRIGSEFTSVFLR